VQIAGGSVSGIDSYVAAGKKVTKGQIFGMIRIGSQVDLIIPYSDDVKVTVREGDKVRAGESILVE
jgi:phosphatidylserine decarboxylase